MLIYGLQSVLFDVMSSNTVDTGFLIDALLWVDFGMALQVDLVKNTYLRIELGT